MYKKIAISLIIGLLLSCSGCLSGTSGPYVMPYGLPGYGSYGVTPCQQPIYVPPIPSDYYNSDNYWQEERAFQEYQQSFHK